MKNGKKLKKVIVLLTFITLLSSIFLIPLKNTAIAAITNLIKNPSFEQTIETNWSIWKETGSSRTYELFRSYDVPYAFGSYSAAIEAIGSPASRFSAGFVTKDASSFNLDVNKNYYLTFYAKASTPTNISVFLEKSLTYEAITEIKEASLNTEWQKFTIQFKPNTTSASLLSVVYGDMPNGSTVYFDGINLFENNIILNTKEIIGFAGEKNKSLSITGIANISSSDIQVELPYFDEQTDTITNKKFYPNKISTENIYFDIEEQTFSGIGKVIIYGSEVGQFNYIIKPKITEFSPSLVRADEDLVIYGSGFNPSLENNFIVLKYISTDGKIYDKWLKASFIDSKLTQLVVKLPAGIASGNINVRTSFRNTQEKDIINVSNSLNYNIMPVIFGVTFSKRGYDQVGYNIQIKGKGIAHNSKVNFYDEGNKKIASYKPTIFSIDEASGVEVIEVKTPKIINKLKVTVMAGSNESEKAQALEYSARPILNTISSKKYRTTSAGQSKIQAAKVGEIITLKGNGFKSIASSTPIVEFQGINKRIKINIDSNNVDINGTWIKVQVPNGAQNGYITVIHNNQWSNSLPIEIIPTIVSIYPAEINPGYEMSIVANGVGLYADLAKVNFYLNKKQEASIKPKSLEASGDNVIIKVNAPRTISSKYTSIKLSYGNWINDETYNITANPVITSAGINLDSKILTVRGHGFSTVAKENVITYMYADHTVITPKVKVLGVYSTSEGQEIRIQILDSYYYGYVKVSVSGQDSNEASFGPVMINKVERRIQFVKNEGRVMGVLYISGTNFGSTGDVKVGDVWAKTHYRTNNFIIAVVEQDQLYNNPVIVTK